MEKYKTKKNNDKKYLSSVVDLSYSELSNELDKEVEAINSSILSLESISKRLGVSHTILRTLFPEKCKIITSRYIKFREIKTKK